MMFWITQTWCVIAILMLALSLLKRSRKVSPALLHALWVVLLLKSLAPPIVAWPYSLPSLVDSQSSTVSSIEPRWAHTDDRVPLLKAEAIDNRLVVPTHIERANSAPLTAAVLSEQPAVNTLTPQSSQATASDALPRIDWILAQYIVLGLWILGSVATLAIELIRILRLNRVLRLGRTEDKVAAEVAAVAKQLGITEIPHRVVNGLTTPYVWSCGAPVLIWPAALNGLTMDARRGLIAHELAHVKRRDHWVAWLELATKVLWWWNPLQVILRRNLRAAADQACDAYVVNSLQIPRRLYAETLLAICETQSRNSAPLASLAAMQSDKRGLEIRLRHVMSKARTYQVSRLTIGIVAVLGLMILPGWSQQPTPVHLTKIEPNDKVQNNIQNGKPIRAKWRPVAADVRQQDLPDGWTIPEKLVDVSGGINESLSVAGIVVDDGNRAVPNAIVILSIFESNYGVAQTNDSGEFLMERIALPIGSIFEHAEINLKAVHPQSGFGDALVYGKDALKTNHSQFDLGKHKLRLDKFDEVHGTVVAPDGTPVQGADVSIAMGMRNGFMQYRAKSEIGTNAKSDVQGHFTLQNVPPAFTPNVQRLVSLDVRHKEWPRLAVRIEDGRKPVVCKFNEGIRLKGSVQFPKEAQNPDAVLSVFSTIFGQRIGSDGTFDFQVDRRLSGKSIVVSCFATADNQTYSQPHKKMKVELSGSELVLDLQPSRLVRGVVKSQDGKPIVLQSMRWKNKDEDSEVGEDFEADLYDAEFHVIGDSVKGGRGAIRTPQLNSFEFDVPRGAGTLIVTYTNQPIVPRKGTVTFPGKQREHAVALEAGVADLTLDVVIPDVPPAEFMVHDVQGNPVQSGNLTLAWTESRTVMLTENSFAYKSLPHSRTVKVVDGRAVAALPESGWTSVLVETDNQLFGWTTIQEEAKSPIDIVVEKPIGWITGRTTVDKKPVPNVSVQLMLNKHQAYQSFVPLPPLKAISDANGEYRLPNIAPLTGYLVPTIPDGLLREGAGVEINLNPGQSLRVEDIKFHRPHSSLAGQVVTPDGQPVAGVEVHIRRSFGSPINDGLYWANDIAPELSAELKHTPYWMHPQSTGKVCAAVSDAEGKFEIPNLPKGEANLYVMRFANGFPETPVQNVIVEVGKQDTKLICPPATHYAPGQPVGIPLQSADGPFPMYLPTRSQPLNPG